MPEGKSFVEQFRQDEFPLVREVPHEDAHVDRLPFSPSRAFPRRRHAFKAREQGGNVWEEGLGIVERGRLVDEARKPNARLAPLD